MVALLTNTNSLDHFISFDLDKYNSGYDEEGGDSLKAVISMWKGALVAVSSLYHSATTEQVLIFLYPLLTHV